MKDIAVTVSPGARLNKVEQLGEFSFKVKTTAPARNNKANQAVLKLLGKYLGLKCSQLILKAGHKSKQKIFSILDK